MITMPVLSIYHYQLERKDELGIGQDVQSLSVPVNGACGDGCLDVRQMIDNKPGKGLNQRFSDNR